MSFSQPLPAFLGGDPVCPAGPPHWPVPDADVWTALQTVYADGTWGRYHGGGVETLEKALCEAFEVSHTVAVGSGTFAVELALRGLKIGPGDEVILSAYDYPGNFHSIHAIGARPVLVDVAADNWNMEPAQMARAIGPATKAVLLSHLHGGLVPVKDVLELAKSYGLAVIEDAAQCPGAVVAGRPAGSWGDVGILSFGGSKLLTAGRGGAVLTNRPDVHQRVRTFLNRGNHVCPLSELQAAVLLPQLAKLSERNTRRQNNVQQLLTELANVAGLTPFVNRVPESRPAYYKLGFQYDEGTFGLPRAQFVAALRAEGIAFDEGFRALHVGRSASRFRLGTECPEATRAHHGVVILHHPVLLGSNGEMADIVQAVHKVTAHVKELRNR